MRKESWWILGISVAWITGFWLGIAVGGVDKQRQIFKRTTTEGAPTVIQYDGVYYRCTKLLDVEKFIDQEKEGE